MMKGCMKGVKKDNVEHSVARLNYLASFSHVSFTIQKDLLNP